MSSRDPRRGDGLNRAERRQRARQREGEISEQFNIDRGEITTQQRLGRQDTTRVSERAEEQIAEQQASESDVVTMDDLAVDDTGPGVDTRINEPGQQRVADRVAERTAEQSPLVLPSDVSPDVGPSGVEEVDVDQAAVQRRREALERIVEADAAVGTGEGDVLVRQLRALGDSPSEILENERTFTTNAPGNREAGFNLSVYPSTPLTSPTASIAFESDRDVRSFLEAVTRLPPEAIGTLDGVRVGASEEIRQARAARDRRRELRNELDESLRDAGVDAEYVDARADGTLVVAGEEGRTVSGRSLNEILQEDALQSDRVVEGSREAALERGLVERPEQTTTGRSETADPEQRLAEQFAAGELEDSGVDEDLAQRISPDDVRVEETDGQQRRVSLREEARRRLARQQAAQDINNQTRIEVTEDDVVLEERDEGTGFRARLDEDTAAARRADRQEIAEAIGGALPAAFGGERRFDVDVARQAEVAEEARQQAAEEDPLRDPEDFTADVEQVGERFSVDVQRRARPFFEEQREALGGDPPEESEIRRTLRDASAAIQGAIDEQATRQEEIAPSVGTVLEDSNVPGSDQVPTVTQGDITRGSGAIIDLPGAVDSAIRAGERAANVAQAGLETQAAQANFRTQRSEELDVEAFDEEIEAQTQAVEQDLDQLETVARTNPGVLVGAIGTGVAASAATGIAAGGALRTVSGRARTVGGTRIDADDLVNPQTRKFYEGEVDDADARFPGAADEDLYQSDPADAVQQQADEFTPDALEEDVYGGTGEDAVLFKALDVEPDGPRTGRAASGLETREGDYESPGAFVGPELSPNFLRLPDADFSYRPGLPSTGSTPTAVAIRTDVEEPDARTLDEFNDELLDRAGETTARTKPPAAVNPDEIEAVIPGEATFRDAIGGGPGRNTLRRLGIGSDYYTEIDGQRVPIRAVEPDGGSGAGLGLLDDDRAQVGAGSGKRPAFRDRQLGELSRRADRPTDRPFPGVGGSSPGASGGSGFSATGFGGSVGSFGASFGGSSSGSSQPSGGSSTPSTDFDEPATATSPSGFSSESAGFPSPTSGGSGGSGSSGSSGSSGGSGATTSGGSGSGFSGGSGGGGTSGTPGPYPLPDLPEGVDEDLPGEFREAEETFRNAIASAEQAEEQLDEFLIDALPDESDFRV